MRRLNGWLRASALLSFTVVSFPATATMGYFALGYGAKAMSLAGAVVSNPQDSITISVNPAGITAVGERLDLGLRFFNPTREAELSTALPAGALGPGSAAISYNVDDMSRRNLFLIPNVGFTRQLGDELWFGFSIYGNGGLNTTYNRNLYNEAGSALGLASGQATGTPTSPPEGLAFPVPDTGTLGGDLSQVIFAPSLATRVRDKHSIGVSLLIGVQRFSARGLGNFQCFTQTGASDPAGTCAATGGASTLTPSDGLTDNGNDWAYGAGARIGWLGEVHPKLTLGASVSSKIYMTEFDEYDELFAEDGDFDIPASFTLGATFKATPKLDLSFDFQRILYEGVAAISNPGPVFTPGVGTDLPCGTGNPACLLGTDDGLGFGWQDINVYRLGAEYAYNSKWTWRAGFSINDQPIPESQVLFNVIATAVMEKHATVGFTFTPDRNAEWNFAYMHGFDESVNTSLSAFGVPASIGMYQNSIELSYSKRF